MKILAIDTSSLPASVSISDGHNLISQYYCDARLTHSQTIMPMTESILRDTKIDISQIDKFVVTHGPGSFTGLRIGLSAVKGMAQILDKPCIGVSTLHSLAYNLLGFSGICCAVMDARCSQVYTAMFDLDNNISRISDDSAISISELKSILSSIDKNIILVGDGADLCYNELCGDIPNVKVAPQALKLQHAYSSALVALSYGVEQTAEQLLPQYLRIPQAERELMNKSKQK